MTADPCTRLGCDAEATHTLHPQYGRSSRWCKDHGAAALDTAHVFDNRSVDGAHLEPSLERLDLPRPRKDQAR